MEAIKLVLSGELGYWISVVIVEVEGIEKAAKSPEKERALPAPVS